MIVSMGNKLEPIKRVIRASLALTLLIVCLQVQAQQMVIIPIGQQKAAAIDLPAQGMAADKVLKRFGEPIRIEGPTGKPPITRWYFEGFSVYFESGFVLHSVSDFVRENTMPTMIKED